MTARIIKYRWLIVGLCLLTGISFGLLIPFSKTDPEIRNYVPATMKSRIATDKIESEFGVQDMIVILFSDSSILTSGNLKQIKDIDHDISRLPGISSRVSPFTVKTIKNSEGMMVANSLIRRIPADSSEVTELTKDILSNRFARDIVFSSDMTSASITATINKSETENITLQKVDSIIGAHTGSARILSGGLPYIRDHIMKDVNRDAVIIVPIALIIMLLVLKLTLGDWRSVLKPFTVVLLSTALSMGLIPLLGWKLSIISLLVPIILVAVANNYGIYLVARHQEISLQNRNESEGSILKELTSSLNMPILFSGLTTIAGILGLLTHSIIPARQVGILAATGVTAALIMSLFFIPALISLGGKKTRNANLKKVKNSRFDGFLNRLAGMIVNHPGKIIVSSLILTIILSSGILLVKIETNQEKYFPKNNPLRQASDVINKKFGGSQTISVMVEGDIKSPEIMKGIDDLTLELEDINGVGGVFSISQAVREMSKGIYNEGESGYDEIPSSREGIAQMFELYNMSGDQNDFKQLMNLDNTKAHLLIRLSNPENKVINEVKEKIAALTNHFPAEVTVGGYAVIMADFAGSVIRGQVSSLIFALITVLVLLAIIFRSLKGGMIGSIPLAASILILFGFMGFTGIALDSATALLSSIMIGVGVDFTIQYMWCFNAQISKGLSYTDATKASIGTIGRSIIINAISVIAGFSALMFSGFTSIRFFGYLVIISISSCLLGALVLIPAILVKFKPGFIEKKLSNSKTKKHEKENDLINIPSAAFTRVGATA
jgi:hydrophobe/amphiphile efflux-3 (HAE3) family protein